jgi:glutamyl-tRNA reductase
VAPLDDLPRLLKETDMVVGSTGAPNFIVSGAAVQEAMAERPERPLLLIDMAVPRDVDPLAARVPGVLLYSMEDLEMAAEANRREREAEALKVERIVREEVVRFQHWWESLEVRPTIAAIRHQAEAIRAAEVERTLQALGEASDEDRARIEAMSKAIIKKVLHRPTRSLYDRRDRELTEAARELFGLDPG